MLNVAGALKQLIFEKSWEPDYKNIALITILKIFLTKLFHKKSESILGAISLTIKIKS